jgi:hypothetical protein
MLALSSAPCRSNLAIGLLDPRKMRDFHGGGRNLPAVPPCPAVGQYLPGHTRQIQRIAKLAKGQQSGIRSDPCSVKLQFQAAVSISGLPCPQPLGVSAQATIPKTPDCQRSPAAGVGAEYGGFPGFVQSSANVSERKIGGPSRLRILTKSY